MVSLETIPQLALFPFLPFLLAGPLVYICGLAIYRVYFHPLAKYPGPLFAKLIDLYQTYHAWRGDRQIEFWRCHEKYGNIVRFGPNSLSFNDSHAPKEIYGLGKANVRKGDFYTAFLSGKDAFSTHSAIGKPSHARKRRVLLHAFSDAAIKSMENHIVAHVQQFCRNIGFKSTVSTALEEWTEAKNMSDLPNYFAFDVMGDLCFGKAFDMQTSPQNRFVIDLISQAATRHFICGTYLPIHEFQLD